MKITILNLIGASDEYFSSVLVNVIIGYLMFAIGYGIKSSGLIKGFNKIFPKMRGDNLNPRRLFFFAVLLFFIGTTTYIYFYEFTMKDATSVDVFRESTAYIYCGLDLLIPAVVILFILSTVEKRFRPVFLLSLISTLYIYIGEGSRYRLIAILLILILLYYFQRQKRPSLSTVGITSVTVLILFATIGIFRRGVSFSWEMFLEAIKNKDIFMRFLSSHGDTAMFDMLVLYFQEIPKNLSYLYGKGFLNLFIHPIPRIFWPEKPIQPSSYFMQEVLPAYFQSGTGFASSIFGDLYWNFGILGMPIGMFLIGVILKSIYSWFTANKDYLSVAVTYSFILAFLPMYLRGEFIGSSVWFLFSFIPTILSLKFSQRGYNEKNLSHS